MTGYSKKQLFDQIEKSKNGKENNENIEEKIMVLNNNLEEPVNNSNEIIEINDENNNELDKLDEENLNEIKFKEEHLIEQKTEINEQEKIFFNQLDHEIIAHINLNGNWK